jgi:uncharacterized membrane protein YidH (DUF202 family)
MKSFFLLLSLFVPSFASAGVTDVEDIFSFQELLFRLLIALNYFLWVLAIVVFMWGVVRFIANADDAEEREKGRHLIIWGIISFVVLLSLWAFVSFILVDTFGIFSVEVPYVNKDGFVVE